MKAECVCVSEEGFLGWGAELRPQGESPGFQGQVTQVQSRHFAYIYSTATEEWPLKGAVLLVLFIPFAYWNKASIKDVEMTAEGRSCSGNDKGVLLCQEMVKVCCSLPGTCPEKNWKQWLGFLFVWKRI